MKSKNVTKLLIIYGTSNSWSLTETKATPNNVNSANTSIYFEGNDKEGYHLVISPEGYLTADSWYESKKEVIEAAKELLNISELEWL